MCTIACYDKAIKEQADVMEGQYVPMTFLPFEEASTNETLAAFMKYVGKDNANGFAVYGWTATLAFKQAVDAIVEQDGVNGLTRANLLSTGIDGLTNFDAGGMIGTVDIRTRCRRRAWRSCSCRTASSCASPRRRRARSTARSRTRYRSRRTSSAEAGQVPPSLPGPESGRVAC